MHKLSIPDAPNSIQKGVPLKEVLGQTAVKYLGRNLQMVHPSFRVEEFVHRAIIDIEPLSLKERSTHLARTMREFLPPNYAEAIEIILKSLTPPLSQTENNGLAPMFYMPHCTYVSIYGVDAKHNNGKDPFDISMKAIYELTTRFTSEFAIRPFIIEAEKRTLDVLNEWVKDKNPHVRRLCTEGTRPRLPWAMKIPSFIDDPAPVIPMLDLLKNDPVLYVRRSVANHLGDIAKDNLDVVLDLCTKWLDGASKELKWVIRHALRNPDKRGIKEAVELRKAAK